MAIIVFLTNFFCLVNFTYLLLCLQEPWLISILTFHAILLLVTIISRRNVNFQLILSALTCEYHFLLPSPFDPSESPYHYNLQNVEVIYHIWLSFAPFPYCYNIPV